MKIVIWTLLLSVLAASTATSADTKILKWVDKQGVTHYGDQPPSFEESKTNVEINKRGMVVKKNDYTVKKINQQDLQLGNQDRKDKILLASYTSASEIDLARERSLEMNKAALTSLASQKENLAARIARNNASADGFKKRNKPLPANLDKEFKDAVASASILDKQMAARKLEMEQTNQNYTQDKARYLVLKQPVTAVETAPAATPVVTPVAEAQPVEKIVIEKLRIDKK